MAIGVILSRNDVSPATSSNFPQVWPWQQQNHCSSGVVKANGSLRLEAPTDRRHPKRILPTATATPPAAAVRPFSSTRGGFVHRRRRRRRRRRKGYHLHTECPRAAPPTRRYRPQSALSFSMAHSLARTNPAEGGAVSLSHSLC